MAKIVDPDSLTQGTEVVINTGAKTIQLVVAGNLDDSAPGRTSGVTLQAIYSFLKEEWKNDASLNKFKFPLQAITEAKMDLVNGWTWADDQTQDLIRDGGWRDTGSGAEYMSVISLGDMDDDGADLAYYQQVSGFDQTTTDMDKTGPLNEPVQIFDGGATDNRDFFKIYLREQGKTYDESDLIVDQDLSVLTYTVYKIPLSNSADIDISTSDGDIDSLAPYTGMSIDYHVGNTFETWTSLTLYSPDAVVQDPNDNRWYITTTGGTSDGTGVADDSGVTDWAPYGGERQIGANWYAFNRIIDGNNASAEEIYEWAQRQLRKSTDINADTSGDAFGTVNGDVAAPLLSFLGNTLQTDPGVYIDNFDVNDQNRIEFFDVTVDGGGLDSQFVPITTTKRTFPFVAAGTFEFSQNLVDDPNAEYTVYFLNDDAGDDLGNDFDTSGAIVVEDDSGTPMSGLSIGSTSISWDFDYDGNTQRGAGSAGVDAPIVVVALGLDDATWISGQFTIVRATGQSFPVNASDERNYSNPA